MHKETGGEIAVSERDVAQYKNTFVMLYSLVAVSAFNSGDPTST